MEYAGARPGSRLGVPGTGEGQDQGQDECAQAELFDALHGAQFRIAVLEKFLGSFQSLDFSAHGQHTHTEVDAQGADHGVRQNVDEPVGIHKFFAGEVLQRCDCGLVHSAADGGAAAAQGNAPSDSQHDGQASFRGGDIFFACCLEHCHCDRAEQGDDCDVRQNGGEDGGCTEPKRWSETSGGADNGQTFSRYDDPGRWMPKA